MPRFKPLPNLQHDHSSTGEESSSHVGAKLEDTDVDARGGESNSSTVGGLRVAAATRSTATTSGGRSADNTSTRGTSLLQERRASSSGLAGALGGGSTVEVTGLGVGSVALVVGVHGERELLLGSADTVGTVLASGGVSVDTLAELAPLVAADGTEGLRELLALNVTLGNTGEALLHALTEILVGRRGERGGGGLPALAEGRAGLQGSVGGLVFALLGTGGGCGCELLREVAEVLEGRGLAVLDGNET